MRGARSPATLLLAAPAGPAVAIGSHPIGLSIEYPLLAHDLGAGHPPIRIGGDTQDAVAPAGTAAHAGVSDLPANFWSRLACLERETRAPIIVGLNLASGRDPERAAEL